MAKRRVKAKEPVLSPFMQDHEKLTQRAVEYRRFVAQQLTGDGAMPPALVHLNAGELRMVLRHAVILRERVKNFKALSATGLMRLITEHNECQPCVDAVFYPEHEHAEIVAPSWFALL